MELYNIKKALIYLGFAEMYLADIYSGDWVAGQGKTAGFLSIWGHFRL